LSPGHLHAADAADAGLQHAFEPGDLCVEVGYLRLAYQASHDSLLRGGAGRYVSALSRANDAAEKL
jgi:hypothetical protein